MGNEKAHSCLHMDPDVSLHVRQAVVGGLGSCALQIQFGSKLESESIETIHTLKEK